jgi:hypothetical protein
MREHFPNAAIPRMDGFDHTHPLPKTSYRRYIGISRTLAKMCGFPGHRRAYFVCAFQVHDILGPDPCCRMLEDMLEKESAYKFKVKDPRRSLNIR